MSIASVVYRREAKAWRVTPGGTVALVFYVMASAALFALAWSFGEGRYWSLAALWALSAGLLLPLLAALATMRLFAGERADGTLELLLTAPAPASEVVAGKFAAALGLVWLGVLAAALPLPLLAQADPAGWHRHAGHPGGALLTLLLQAVTWTALGTLASALARRVWGAATGMLLLLLAALVAWSVLLPFLPALRARAPLFPLVAELFDGATGRVSLNSLMLHLSVSGWLLFASARALEGRPWR